MKKRFKKIKNDEYKMLNSNIYLYVNKNESLLENKDNRKNERITNVALHDEEYIDFLILNYLL